MDYNHTKPNPSNHAQYGENYYAPPPMYQNNNDVDSNSTQASKNLFVPEMDPDAMAAMKIQQHEQQDTAQRDQAGMYQPIFPMQNKVKQDYTIHYEYPESNKPVLKHDHNCTNCYDCQMRRERERRQRQDQEDCEMCMKCWCECLMICCIGFCEAHSRR